MSQQPTADTLRHVQQRATQTLVKADTVRQQRSVRIKTDSLVTDSLALDSLALDSLAVDTLPIIRPAFRDVEASTFFGVGTTLAQQPRIVKTNTSYPDVVIFQGFVLVLLVFYARFIIRHIQEARLLVSQTLSDALTGKQRIYDEQGNIGYLQFINAVTIIGLFLLGCGLASYAAPQVALPLPEVGKTASVALIASLSGFGLGIFQLVALRLCGMITLTQPFILRLLFLKRTYLALLIFVLIPPLLLTIFTPAESHPVWDWLILAELGIVVILFVKESLHLFLAQKISILHWFLYLCAVECLPISFLWLCGR